MPLRAQLRGVDFLNPLGNSDRYSRTKHYSVFHSFVWYHVEIICWHTALVMAISRFKLCQNIWSLADFVFLHLWHKLILLSLISYIKLIFIHFIHWLPINFLYVVESSGLVYLNFLIITPSISIFHPRNCSRLLFLSHA